MFHNPRRTTLLIVISLFLLLFSSWQIALSAPSSPRDNPDFWDKLSSVVLIDPTWTIPPPAEPFSFPQTVTDLVSILGDLPLGPNVLCNQDDTSQAQNEPSIDVNPFDPNHVIATSNDYRLRVGPPPENDVRAGYYASFDGGNTWPGDGIIDISTIPNTFAAGDPSIAIHDLHNVYYSYIAFNRSTDDGGVAVSKSTDGGLTWQDPVVVAWNSASIFRDKDYMAVDATGSPYDGNVYVTWTNFAYGTPIYFSRSTDGGATFSSPFRISDSEYDSNQGSLPVVGPDGVLYVAWLNYYPSSIRMVKSTNGGSSFGTPFEVAAVDEIPSPLPGGDFRDNSFPTMAIDPNNGNIYVAWSDYRNGDADIYFTRSTNDGSTWSTPIRINDDPLGNDAHQFFPWMDVAPNGKLYLSWFDSRNDPTPLVSPLLYDEYAAASTDGGLTFSLNQRISEVTSDSSIGGFTTPFIGDYSGLAVTNDFIFPAWVDTRRDQEDIYTQRTENVQGHKSAPEWVDPLASFSYSIVIQSTSDISANQVDDPIPEGALYVLTSAWASSGLVDYSGGIVTWNGDISSGVPITITFDVTPTASACLSITNSALLTTGQGLSLTMEATSIITGPVPSPEFSWSSSELVFTFTNETSATTPTDYLWDFGDGITSTETSPVHEYTLPGDYLVTLLAANLCGSAEISHAINAACSAPQAAFTWLADELTITFTNQTSGHFPLSFLWDFGDAITGTLESPVHDYSYAGTFDVTLYATDFCGIGSLTQPVTTTCTDTSAFFTWQADGLLVSFTNGSSGTLPLEYVWDFGDGTTSAERSPSHQYTIPGRYDVLLTVSGPCGVAEYQAIVGAGRFIFMPLAVKH